jgi:hypothetical protein
MALVLLLTRLRGGENSRLPGDLEGLLVGTFGYYLLLVTFGLMVASLHKPPRASAPRTPNFLRRPVQGQRGFLLTGARKVGEYSANYPCVDPLPPTYFRG